MRLPDDDELYEVDQTYLGPPGRYIGVMRHKTIFAALIVLPLCFVIIRRLGIPLTLMSVGLTLIGGVGLAMVISDHTSSERTIASLMTSMWHDLAARREPAAAARATGEGIRKITAPTGLPRRIERRTQRAAHADRDQM